MCHTKHFEIRLCMYVIIYYSVVLCSVVYGLSGRYRVCVISIVKECCQRTKKRIIVTGIASDE